jgi:LPXTG-site transpeptidase (sortase) family protein
MSKRRAQTQDDEQLIPIGMVITAIGFIILLAVAAVWLIVPAKMPQPLYDLIGPYLQRSNDEALLPTAVPLAVVPTNTPIPEEINLLPESPLGGDELPDYFVSALDASAQGLPPGQPQRIEIPAIRVDAVVTSVGLQAIQQNGQTYYQWQVPNSNKAGWHNGTALLGQRGNTVLNGHHNIFGEVFRDIVNLQEGDEIIVYDRSRAFHYRVTSVEIFAERGEAIDVRLANAKWAEPTEDERLTLVTCWPYTDNSHRVVVVAEPVPTADSG